MKKPKLSSLLANQNPQFAELYRKFNLSRYNDCYDQLSGRILTPTVSQKRNGLILAKYSDRLLSLLTSIAADGRKHGLFITKQRCKAVKGWCDPSNATSFDSFVIEFDNCCLIDEQLALLNKSGMPRTALIFSGNKSIHCLVTLAQPVTESRLREFVSGVARVFPQADRAVLNDANGFFRFPVIHKDCFQPLIEFNGSVKNKTFEDWLSKAAPASTSSSSGSSYQNALGMKDEEAIEARILAKVCNLIRGAFDHRHSTRPT